PWVWLVVVPASDQADANPQGTFARSFLCLMAAWQSLQAYPIAGTQVATATILLVPVYAICLRDGCRSLASRFRIAQWFRQLAPRQVQFVHAFGAVGLLYVFA